MNTFIFVALMAGTATFMYVLVKFGRTRSVKIIIKAALAAVIFLLINWYGGIFLQVTAQPIEFAEILLIGAAVLITTGLAFATYVKRGLVQVMAVAVIGALTGTFLGASVPLLTSVILLIGLAIYDLFAVFKGPIGKIAAKTELDDFVGAVFTYKDLTVGMGDMVFYSMLASTAMINFGLYSFTAASLGIILGAFLGFKMLEAREIFPGLPIALGLGLALMLSLAYLQGRL